MKSPLKLPVARSLTRCLAAPALLAAALLGGCALAPQSPGLPAGSQKTASKAPGIAVIESDGELLALRQSAAREGALRADAQGYYLDVQTARLQALARAGVTVTRQPDRIVVVIPGANSFASNSASLTADMRAFLDELASVLTEYQESLVLIGGHSDSVGDPDYNLSLSRQRALAVGHYLTRQQISPERLVVRGFGDAQPVADNATEAGRAGNRRIELTLWPMVREPNES